MEIVFIGLSLILLTVGMVVAKEEPATAHGFYAFAIVVGLVLIAYEIDMLG